MRHLMTFAVLSLGSFFLAESSAFAWHDQTHLAISQAAGYQKWYNSASADMAKDKVQKVEMYNHWYNNNNRVEITPQTVMEQIDRYNSEIDTEGHLYGAIIASLREFDSMLSCIVEESSRLNHIKYSREYPDVFYTIDQYILPKLKNNVRDDLVFALDALLSTDITELSAGLNRLRCIVESILFSINNFDKSIIPDEKVRNYKGNEEVKFGDTMKHLTLTGRLVQYGIIDQSLWRVYKTASKYGAHPDLAKEDFFSSYSYRAIVYQTLDIFLWYRALREGVI